MLAQYLPHNNAAPTMYRQRQPEGTTLYQVVAEHLETYLEVVRSEDPDGDPIPEYVENTLREYLKCGIPAHGFSRVYCAHGRHEYILPFSCKRRGVCPSCNTRWMVETAAYLVDQVMPRVPVRQWVLVLPKRLRYFLNLNAKVAGDVLKIFLRCLETAIIFSMSLYQPAIRSRDSSDQNSGCDGFFWGWCLGRDQGMLPFAVRYSAERNS